MSEEEKRKRADYKKKRKTWIIIQAVLVLILSIVTLGSFGFYYQLNKAYYIDYTESSAIDYKVYLKENDFYDEEYLGKGQAYVASLINSITADFSYALDMETENVNYEYSYKIDAELIITDKDSNATVLSKIKNIKEEQKFAQNSNNVLRFNEQISLNYDEYNHFANQFQETYGLDVTYAVIVRMHVNVLSVCDNFEQDTKNEYVTALHIPLTNKTVHIEMTSSIPTAESKILACDRALNKNIFLNIAFVAGGLDLILIIVLIAFIYLTRNKDINYTIKVKKILSGYRSFIQVLQNEFDKNGYQVLKLSTFNEMLDIRDTIQSPILMRENEDQTCTEFIIPTDTKLLYLYEIKVEGYDELYKTQPEAEQAEKIEETLVEEVIEEKQESTQTEILEEKLEDMTELQAEEPKKDVEEIEKTEADKNGFMVRLMRVKRK